MISVNIYKNWILETQIGHRKVAFLFPVLYTNLSSHVQLFIFYSHVMSKEPTTSEDQLDLKQLWNIEALDFQLRNLLGEVLTLIDASAPSKEQAKAQKDLIKHMFSRKLNYIAEVMYKGKTPVVITSMLDSYMGEKV